jgi:hypothetical protein
MAMAIALRVIYWKSKLLFLEEGERDGEKRKKKRLHTSMTAEASLICPM